MDIKGAIWLGLYIFMNLMTTLLNKAILQTYDVPFPETLVLWHYTCTAAGALVAVRGFRITKPAELDWSAHRKLFLFSVLFNINILISAVSLHMVSMAMHQIVRSLSPAFTLGLSIAILGKSYPYQVYMSLIAIFLGVVIYASKGEVNYSILGAALTLLGAFLASLKGVLTNMFMVGTLKLHPFDLLQYMSIYAFLQLGVVLWLSGELSRTFQHLANQGNPETIVMIVINGLGAFLLNVVSFNANKNTSPLAMSVGAIAKQVLAIVIGIIVFATPITAFSLLGVGVTICGIAWYTMASYWARQQPSVSKVLPTTAAPITRVSPTQKDSIASS